MLQALLASLRTLRAARTRTGRAQQLQHDAQRIYKLLQGASEQRAAQASDELVAHAVNKHLTAELQRALHATHQALCNGGGGGDATTLHEAVQRRLGFVPVVQPSLVRGGGNGLFVRGRARAGSLLALFPGLFFNMSDVPAQVSDLAIARYDGVVVDSSHPITISVGGGGSGGGSGGGGGGGGDDQLREDMAHPFATAHYANHGTPNALQFMLDVPRGSVPAPLYDLVPVRAARTQRSMLSFVDRWADAAFIQRVPGSELYTMHGSHVLKTVALVALRDIHDGEEIRFNYRFNPGARQLPQWYSDPEPEVSRRRWQQSSVLW